MVVALHCTVLYYTTLYATVLQDGDGGGPVHGGGEAEQHPAEVRGADRLHDRLRPHPHRHPHPQLPLHQGRSLAHRQGAPQVAVPTISKVECAYDPSAIGFTIIEKAPT